ncbi:hypothetical protein RclHR1_00010004 [Rhizophagus clarus]|uniref:F-box domain-containing protein n=1 Tax=Rhizophagus clarus TaxID=94130 RepID=A0A2Z6Q4Q0_9GLOM|nr:hypothetical protein RclHR1_00010004 [Rhizophagus clarus]GES75206.1 hypothetical protein GLOIN_2v904198 [Rhizophagus clarus]
MPKLYKDILYLIFKELELQYQKKSLVSCLTVDKTWCETVVLILWKNPWIYYGHNKEELLLNTIISHSTDEARNNLSQYFNFLTSSSNKPLFNYLSFCRHLNLEKIENIIKESCFTHTHFKEIRNSILNLFINENMEYTHLYVSQHFDHRIVPGAELCFSKVEYLEINGRINDNILLILTKTCKSIKEVNCFIFEYEYNYRIAKLIENQKSLINIKLLVDNSHDTKSHEIIEKALIKQSNTIQYFNICGRLETKVLSSFVNLKILELTGNYDGRGLKWDNTSGLFLPSLQTLKASNITCDFLVYLIENSGRQLIEINYHNNYSHFHNIFDNRRLIQAIYHNCPNLMYLGILYRNDNIVDFEKLLVNCQNLKRLEFFYEHIPQWCEIQQTFYTEWDNLFNILIKSPPSLFDFIFKDTEDRPGLESLKLFLDKWEGRQPVSFAFDTRYKKVNDKLVDLIGRYNEKGVVKKYIYYDRYFEDVDLLDIYRAKRDGVTISYPKEPETSNY